MKIIISIGLFYLGSFGYFFFYNKTINEKIPMWIGVPTTFIIMGLSVLKILSMWF